MNILCKRENERKKEVVCRRQPFRFPLSSLFLFDKSPHRNLPNFRTKEQNGGGFYGILKEDGSVKDFERCSGRVFCS